MVEELDADGGRIWRWLASLGVSAGAVAEGRKSGREGRIGAVVVDGVASPLLLREENRGKGKWSVGRGGRKIQNQWRGQLRFWG